MDRRSITSSASRVSLPANDDEIRPYSIHVSSKYLNLTQKKLELTRLPHEILLPASREWEQGTPKSAIEPLIDFWLEKYSWRDQEVLLNNTVRQYRTAFKISQSSTPIRIHFIHMRSNRSDAVPLLLLPAFPMANLSLIPLIQALTAPSEFGQRSFHVVVPALPGIGFSDSFMFESAEVLTQTASIFNTLMQRLSYTHYVVSNSGSAAASPDHIDYHLARILATLHADNCIGLHLISPPSSPPSFLSAPLLWFKYQIASVFGSSIFDYESSDFKAMKKTSERRGSLPYIIDDETAKQPQPVTLSSKVIPVIPISSRFYSMGLVGLREPSSLAYALCDSPVGLLSLVISVLRNVSPKRAFTSSDIITFTQLAWLPGPESSMRFWASAVKEIHEDNKSRKACRTPVGVTVFLDTDKYRPPAWAQVYHKVITSHRASGAAGLVSWDQCDAVVEGLRTFCAELGRTDPRIGLPDLNAVVVDNLTVGNKNVVDSMSRSMSGSMRSRPRGLGASSLVDVNEESVISLV